MEFTENMLQHRIISRSELARKGLIPSLKIAGQWRFKKEVIDKWINKESLERVTQNIKSSAPVKKHKENK